MAKRVLIVEDEPDIQEVERMVAEDLLSCEAEVACTGEEAIEKVAVAPPDLIVLDLVLPGVDGFEVAAHVRADPSLGHVRILALSGLARGEDRQRALAAGCDSMLEKPFDLDELVVKMASLLEICVPAN